MADAVVLILTKDNKILLQRRDEHAPKYPNLWGLISGAIKPGESPEQALQREAQEELNYKVSRAKLLWKVDRPQDGTKFYFEAPYDGAELSVREGAGIVWWPSAEALRLAMIPHHRAALARWQKKPPARMREDKRSP
ncbi:MAG: NUDIX hydrolase [Patescibacteria group bacterium]|nr:NUDIX hydrolase [Patescibacteria group bacterium]